ncbi:MAG: YgdI/YgdR family lipoprotein [Fimbriimonadaceae bacterium]|jgi:hypothetical protein|nr:YgdI/YgdR family lipoprotein [Fimbriimonadaceae bacterium]
MTKFFAPFLCISALFLAGCASDQAATPATPGTPSSSTAPATAASSSEPKSDLPAGMTAFKGTDGVVTCPLMGDKIPDVSKAVGFVDHENVRYYLCCPACLKQFQSDPAKFAAQAKADLEAGKL